jgi:hypothetical protein
MYVHSGLWPPSSTALTSTEASAQLPYKTVPFVESKTRALFSIVLRLEADSLILLSSYIKSQRTSYQLAPVAILIASAI